MAKKTTRKAAKKTTKKTTRGKKPRPSLKAVRKEMARLSNDLDAIILAGEDKSGQLSKTQLDKAQRTKDGLDAALKSVKCGQTLAPY